MKSSYKELRKKLKDEFILSNNNNYYGVLAGVGVWVLQCGIKPTSKHTEIICNIFGSVPYPYQQRDRKVILKYLKENKYKVYKKEFNATT